MEKGYKKLIVWKKAHELACQIYLVTKSFPQEELFGITSQLRRSSLSIPTNIVEGAGRQNKNELKHYSRIALGSLAETEYLLEVCLKLNFINKETFDRLESIRNEVGALLWNFHKSF